MCGYTSEGSRILPLVSVEELKAMKTFEAVFLLARMMPFKGKLVPDYKADWGYSVEYSDFELRK